MNSEHKHQLEFIHLGGEVKRYHTVPMLTTQTIASHSFNVAWFVYMLSEEKPSADLLMAALSHDLAEQYFGDMPGNAKRELKMRDHWSLMETAFLNKNRVHFMLSHEEMKLLDIADQLEGMLRCTHERMLGNKYIEVVYGRYKIYVETHLDEAPETARELFNQVQSMWSEATNQGETNGQQSAR